MFDRNEKKNVELTAELAALERQLAAIAVAPLHIDRDRLMFEAGRAACLADRQIAATGHRPQGGRVAGPPRWFWPSAAAMMAAACVVLAAMLVWRQDAVLVAQDNVMPHAAAVPRIEAPTAEELREVERLAASARRSMRSLTPTGGYFEKRYIALTRGVDELRSEGDGGNSFQSGDATQPATARELLREFVPPSVTITQSNS